MKDPSDRDVPAPEPITEPEPQPLIQFSVRNFKASTGARGIKFYPPKLTLAATYRFLRRKYGHTRIKHRDGVWELYRGWAKEPMNRAPSLELLIGLELMP